MDIVFGYFAGLLTLLNPCVLPVLPVILIGALNQHRLGPLALCAGLTVAFVTIGMFVAALGPALGIDDQVVSKIAAVLMMLFGAILVVPALSAKFSFAASGLSNSLSVQTSHVDDKGLTGQFLTGLLLGGVWSPCIGPTLGGAIALASQGSNLIWASAIMLSFALGVSTIIMVLATVSREALFRRRDSLQQLSHYARPIMGALLLTLGFALFFNFHHVLEIWAVQNMPIWLQDLSVKF